MRPKELEKVMVDFLENKTQVLVCSAIIESGLDFPNANTIIINRADKFGLAQLYQLRGRVGRSHRHAYAYLLIPGEKAITPDAERRLRALQEIDGLGGGFKLALHDLEIRGAGQFAGRSAVGTNHRGRFRALHRDDGDKRFRSSKAKKFCRKSTRKFGSVSRLISRTAIFPTPTSGCISTNVWRVCETARELDELKEEIKDRFGPYGEVVENLFLVMNLRRASETVSGAADQLLRWQNFLLFHAESPVKVEKLLDLIHKQKSRFRLSPDGRLSFAPRNQEWEELMDEVRSSSLDS